LIGAERVLRVFSEWSHTLQSGGHGGNCEIGSGLLPHCVYELCKACVAIEGGVGVVGDLAAVCELKTQLLGQVDKYMGPQLLSPTAQLKAAAMDPNKANLACYGVPNDVIDEVWAAIVTETTTISPAHATIAPHLVGQLRKELEDSSKAVQQGGHHVNVLAFWRAKVAQPPSESLLGAVFSETARGLLSLQLSSAASE
jgi:hypothetical protein